MDPTPEPDAQPTPEPAAQAAPQPDQQPPPQENAPGTFDDGKLWAMLSYASMFMGFPIFIVPLAMRDNEFALYHARQAAGIYVGWLVLFMVVFVFSFITCGFGAMLVPVIFIAYIPSIHGIILASNGEMREPMMLYGLGDALFGRITTKG